MFFAPNVLHTHLISALKVLRSFLHPSFCLMVIVYAIKFS